MAAISVIAAMSADGDRNLHPFFRRPAVTPSVESISSDPGATSTAASNDVTDVVNGNHDKPQVKPKQTKLQQTHSDQKRQRTLNDIINPQARGKDESGPETTTLPAESNVEKLGAKRRRTGDSDFSGSNNHGDGTDHAVIAAGGQAASAVHLVDDGAHQPPQPQAGPLISTNVERPQTPPKKVLRLRADGRFSSPVSKVSEDEAAPVPARRGRGRPRKSAQPPKPLSLVVKVQFRSSEARAKVSRMLNNEERIQAVVPSSQQSTSKRTPKKNRKSTHPFFAGKKSNAEPPKPPKPPTPRKTITCTTPGKLRAQAFTGRIQEPSRESAHVVGSDLLKDRLMIKHPGARDPPFPDREQAHVRSLSSDEQLNTLHTLHDFFPLRKRKQAKQSLPASESVLNIFASQLSVEDDRRVRPDGYLEPSADLIVPERLLLPGEEIAKRVATQIPCLQGLEADELSLIPPPKPHPAVLKLHSTIPHTFTAYDRSTGESLSWTQKYAPLTSADVLQPSEEMSVLKKWLQSLVVQTVGGGSVEKPSTALACAKPPKRRKKKHSEMDDFLVDSDEEISEMNEIGHEHSPANGVRQTQKSVVQTGSSSARLNNVILLSGPSGCGKTAAAYAVAKELSFKVFEISPSERRSGKDVVDRIGNMTENHLVKHHGSSAAVDSDGEHSTAEDPGRHDQAFQRDLESGRQGKMNAFFKPQTKPKQIAPKKLVPKSATATSTLKAVTDALKKPAKDQQQSIILLEEVDILFKEDKDFWTTILRLMASSKRPFLLTCNDEALVPLHLMTFHAILRFTPPALDVGTDYMLLMAAAEGHLLKREAVSALFRRHNHDLRASIAELDFWCQMSVGDPKSGLSWIYQRWPPGSDLDDQGRKLRVVSDGTYEDSMSLHPSGSCSSEDALAWAWNEFDVPPAVAVGWHELSSSVVDDHAADLHRLRDLSRYADAMSAMDLVASSELQTPHACDPSRRPLTDKQRGQYIEGQALLQTDEPKDYRHLSRDIAISLTLSAVSTSSGLHGPSTLDSTSILTNMLSRKSRIPDLSSLSRSDFSALDPIALDPDLLCSSFPSSSSGLIQSVLDGCFTPIVLDIAPYVRSILQYDQAVGEMRSRLDAITSVNGSQGSNTTRRARTTRAARSALEGGTRATTRREKWFAAELDVPGVLATAGETWPKAGIVPQFESDDTVSTTGASSVDEPVMGAGSGDLAPAVVPAVENGDVEGNADVVMS